MKKTHMIKLVFYSWIQNKAQQYSNSKPNWNNLPQQRQQRQQRVVCSGSPSPPTHTRPHTDHCTHPAGAVRLSTEIFLSAHEVMDKMLGALVSVECSLLIGWKRHCRGNIQSPLQQFNSPSLTNDIYVKFGECYVSCFTVWNQTFSKKKVECVYIPLTMVI